jgi:hypothetical protein
MRSPKKEASDEPKSANPLSGPMLGYDLATGLPCGMIGPFKDGGSKEAGNG